MKKSAGPTLKPQKPRMVQITLRVPDEVHAAVKALALEFRISMAAVVRCAIVLSLLDSMELHPKTAPRGKIAANLRKEWAHYIVPALEKRWRGSSANPDDRCLSAPKKAKK